MLSSGKDELNVAAQLVCACFAARGHMEPMRIMPGALLIAPEMIFGQSGFHQDGPSPP